MNAVNSHEESSTSQKIEASNEAIQMNDEQGTFKQYIDMTEEVSACYVLGYN